MTVNRSRQSAGFSLIEMMIALLIFLVITGIAFTLLSMSQNRYQTDSQVLDSFQDARLGIDQIVRDIDAAGYPPKNQFQFSATNNPPVTGYVTSPFAWPNDQATPGCSVDLTCTITPTGTDLIIETQVPGQGCLGGNDGVSWIHYQLAGTTLLRGVVCKAAGDPNAGWGPANLVPFIQNVVNANVFSYFCDSPQGPLNCQNAAVLDSTPSNIRAIGVTLQIQAPAPDPQTGLVRRVELNGRGTRINPLQ